MNVTNTHPTLPHTVRIEGSDPRGFRKSIFCIIKELDPIRVWRVEDKLLHEFTSYRSGTIHFSVFGKFEVVLDNGVTIS